MSSLLVATPLAERDLIAVPAGRPLGALVDAVRPPGCMFLVLVDGELLVEAEWRPRCLEPGERAEVMILPGGGGGGSGKVIRAVAMIAIVALAAYAAPLVVGAIAPTLGGTGFAVASAVTKGLITAVGGALVNAVLPAPSSQSRPIGGLPAPSPTYSAQAQGNAARIGQPIPRIFGRHKVTPDYAAPPWAEFSGNKQRLHWLFCVGFGAYDVEALLIGETLAWTAADGSTGVFDDIQVEVVDPGDPVTLFPASVYVASEVAGAILEPPNEGGTWVGPFPATVPGVTTARISVDFVMPRGLFRPLPEGGLTFGEVRVVVETRQIDDAGAPLGDGSWTELMAKIYNTATTTPQRITEDFPLADARWEVRVRRTTDFLGTEWGEINDIAWAGLRAFLDHAPVYGQVTVVAVEIVADADLSSAASRQVSLIGTSRMRGRADGDWAAPAASSNPAWAALEILTDAVAGLDVPEARLDLAAFEALAATCASRGDRLDIVLDQAQVGWQALRDVLLVCRAQPVAIGDRISVVRDAWAPLARHVFTHEQIVRGSHQTRYLIQDDGSPDDVVVEYWDAETWSLQAVTASLDGSASAKAARVRLMGITSRDHAWREGVYQAAANRERRAIHTFEVEYDGRSIVRGDAALLPVLSLDHGGSGIVEDWDPATLTLLLSEPVTFAPLADHYISLRRADGSEWGPCLCTAGTIFDGYDDAAPGGGGVIELVLDADDHDLVADQQGATADAVITLDPDSAGTAYVVGAGTTAHDRCLVIDVRARGEGRIEIMAQRDREAVHLADTGEPPAETETPVTVTPDAPVIGRLDVTQRVAEGEPILDVAIAPAAGADRYLVRYSLDEGDSWSLAYAGSGTETAFAVPLGTIQVQAAAIGLLRGPWTDAVEIETVDQAALPAPASGLGLLSAWRGDGLEAAWAPAARAARYVVALSRETTPGSGTYDVTVEEREIGATELLLTAQTLVAAGGRVRRLQLGVTSRNAFGDAEETVLAIEDAAPAVPTVGTVTVTTTAITVPFTPLDPAPADLVTYRLYASDTTAFEPGPETIVDEGLTSPLEITGLAPETTRYMRLVAVDGFGEPLTYSAEFDAETDAS